MSMVLLPAARADLSSTTAVSTTATISTPLTVQVERVSSEFSRFAALHQATAQLDSTTVNSAQWLEAAEAALTAFDVSRSATPDSSASSKRRAGDAAIDDVYDAAEDPELLRSSPRNWKSLDLYAVLGLSKLRYKATSGQLKSAYHRKVLVHHPDRKVGKKPTAPAPPPKPKPQPKLLDLGTGDADDDEEEEDAFFKIVQKAYETLSNPTKRREYDSVDPFYYESSIETAPPASKPSSDADFFALYGPVFEREARFASKTPAPTLGDMTSSYDQIQGFYSYWGSFQSWRSFEFLDEEDKESAENRDHRRYLERKNKAERARRKTEDTRRVQKIVEQAQRFDPRIVAFKEKEKQAKQQKKLAKEAAAKEAELAAKAEAEAQQKREEEEAAAAKEQQAAEKRQRETAKKQVQKARKQLRDTLAATNWLTDGNASTSTVSNPRAAELDVLVTNLSFEEVQAYQSELEKCAGKVPAMVEVTKKQVASLIAAKPLLASNFVHFKDASASKRSASAASATASTSSSASSGKESPWSAQEMSLLIKAVNKFPGGTGKRWETIAEYVSQHSGATLRSSAEIISKSREVRMNTVALENAEIRQLQSHKKRNDDRMIDEISVRLPDGDVAIAPQSSSIAAPQKPASGSAAAANKPSAPSSASSAASPAPTASDPSSWKPSEQLQLEAALRKYPPSWAGEGDRWDNIAAAVQGRTKKECKQRVKYLMEQVKGMKK